MTAAAWHPDPTGKHELRYWDGTQWTEHVADAGVQATDPLVAPAAEQSAEQSVEQSAHRSEEQAVAPAADEPADQPVDRPAEAADDPVAAEPAAEQPPVTQVAPAQASYQAAPHQPMPQQPAGAPYGGGAGGGIIPGVSGELVDGRYSESASTAPGPMRQNDRMLRVRVAEPFMAKQGAMIAYQGAVQFNYQGSGASKFLKKAFTGEGLSLMRVEGQGDVFLADNAKKVHVLHLANSGISINSGSILAFSTSLEWNVERVKGGSMAAGGLFNTTLRGTGWVAITTDGDPVVLNTAEAPTFTDTDALVAWSVDLQTSINSTMSAGALIGRGSGEAIQVAFSGHGFVIVQPAEGGVVPPHTH
jgi:uncharacterized protein (AIM24 family)